MIESVKRLVNRVMAWPAVVRVTRANDRYTERFGKHFAASITYFTVMAIVPVISFAFSMLSLLLIRVRPDLIARVEELVVSTFGGVGNPGTITRVIDQALRMSGSWWTIVLAILTALWAGLGWVGNLRAGIRAQWEDDPALASRSGGFVQSKLRDAAVFAGLLVVFIVVAAVGQAGTSLAGVASGLLHLDRLPGHRLLLTLAGLVSATIASALLLLFLFATLTTRGRRWRVVVIGSVVAGFALAVIQVGAGYLIVLFGSNRAVQAFGSVIVSLLVVNLIAQIILFAAAWIGTSGTGGRETAAGAVDET